MNKKIFGLLFVLLFCIVGIIGGLMLGDLYSPFAGTISVVLFFAAFFAFVRKLMDVIYTVEKEGKK